MINEPDTRDLLAEARQVLLDSLAPELAGERKYQALMIANAMGVAIREIEQREQGEPETTDRSLSHFLAGHQLPDNPEQGEQTLARALRERRLDGSEPELRLVLRGMTEARLRINNPGYLKSSGQSNTV
ncbi:DUF6285 domain-containing protein [Marinobacter sp. F4218]|uniref:DUF6285 domain-containing protein n=1 Tax=Marinobacter sp. F4218 TaxID=2862868 RepID=UPI001C6259A2|nr:DUF6285 domain-containing protein [Marinobacter sp. F4218]MBW7469731.1 acyl-CoA dehydrogenase [Marinobacter sp. F4218]